jgi:uncharacterized protein (TIGR02099 family)
VPLFRKVLRALFWTCFVAYLAAVGVLLGMRYWVLPQIDQWRPDIEAYASEALGAEVSIGQLKADWSGLNPSLQVTSLRVHGDAGQADLNLPSVTAVLAWRSVLVMSPRLLSLRVDGPEISIRRDTADHLWVAGQSVSLRDEDDSQGAEPFLRWLSNQRDLAVVGATVRWHDEWQQTPEVALRNVNVRFFNGLVNHRFTLSAQPPAALASGITLTGVFHRNMFDWHAPAWTGELYADLQDADVQAWKPWVPMPDMSGRVDGRAWLTWEQGELTDLVGDAAVRDLTWQETMTASAEATSDAVQSGDAIKLVSGRLHIQGVPGDLIPSQTWPLKASRGHTGMTVQATLNGVQATLPELFNPAVLQLDTLSLEANLSHLASQPLTAKVKQLSLKNHDAEIHLHGLWTGEGKTVAGTADFQGSIVRGSMPAIYKYLPLTVDADARDWMAHGLPAGQITQASVVVKGDLDEFPFEDPTDHGQFRIAGAFRDAIVDAAPPSTGDKGWPRLEQVSGTFVVDKVSLALESPGGAVSYPGTNQRLKLDKLTASIPNMEVDSTLHFSGLISGAVDAFLALSANYELGQLLDGLLDEAEGKGNWEVPLTLEVPLLNPEDAKVQGKVKFAGNDFRFIPEMPMLRNVQGELLFSEQGARAENLRGVFLGGTARVTGKLEKPTDVLNVTGTVTSAAIAQWSKDPILKNIEGKTAYRARIGTGPGGVLDLVIESDLVGLASNLPAPFQMDADKVVPLKAHWGATSAAASGKRDQLSIYLGNDFSLLLEHDRQATGSFFSRGVLGLDRQVSLPAEPGLVIDARMPTLDVDAWQSIADEAERALAQASSSARPQASAEELWPPLKQVDLRTGKLRIRGLDFDDLTLKATRPALAQWKMDVASRQAGGTISWRDVSGDITGIVIARFKHLDLGVETEVATSLPVDHGPTPERNLSRIPALDLKVEEFSLYGRKLGKLEVQGTSLQQGRIWQLGKLWLGNAAGSFDATGTWALTGVNRGLTIEAKAQFSNLGAFMDHMGMPGKLSGGVGAIDGSLTWRDLPWTHDLNNIEGKFQASLDNGRLSSVESRSARLLELLSLQSLQRIATLDANPAKAFRDGFPFDTIRGALTLSNGVANIENYKLDSPVATIVLTGDTDIISEQWNMKAVVVPNLDVSGAAVITGLAVNPVIGIGAFLTQWLLKRPLARAMTLEYGVTGTWDDPKLDAIEAKHTRREQEVQEYIQY